MVVFNIGLRLVAEFIENSNSAEIVGIAEAMLNTFLQNQFAKSELSKYEHSRQPERLGKRGRRGQG